MPDFQRANGGPQLLLLAFLTVPLSAVAAPDIDGVWMLDGKYHEIGYTYSDIVYTPEGQRRHDAVDILTEDPSLKCLPSGPGRIWDNPGAPIELKQYDDRVVIRYEVFDLIRTIKLNQHGHPLDAAPSTVNLDGVLMPTMGHSIGWYEGDALVVETVGYAAGLITTLHIYVPQSEAMRSIERYYRDGNWLAVDITYVDPITLAKPLEVKYRLRRSDFAVEVYGCTPENAGYDEGWPEAPK